MSLEVVKYLSSLDLYLKKNKQLLIDLYLSICT